MMETPDRSHNFLRQTIAIRMKPVVAMLGGLALFLPGAMLSAATVEYDLTITRRTMNFTGHPVQAMVINGQLPGPTLRFTEGDRALIRVHNQMDVETSVHWHGILLPNAMDGVPFLTYPPIAPGKTFTYEFDLRQSGTYWYHSHTLLQEQRGLFGALVVGPKATGEFDRLRDHVVVLSDWTDEDASSVLHTLKRGSEWYSVKKGSGQSVLVRRGWVCWGRIFPGNSCVCRPWILPIFTTIAFCSTARPSKLSPPNRAKRSGSASLMVRPARSSSCSFPVGRCGSSRRMASRCNPSRSSVS